jgi:hypothetical protein
MQVLDEREWIRMNADQAFDLRFPQAPAVRLAAKTGDIKTLERLLSKTVLGKNQMDSGGIWIRIARLFFTSLLPTECST